MYGEPAGRVIFVRAALFSVEEAARISRESVPNDGGDVKKHDGNVSEVLTSQKGHIPDDDRAFEYLPSAKVRRENATLAPGTQTEACEIFNTHRCTRAHRQEYQTHVTQHAVRGCRRKSSGSDDASLSCDRTRELRRATQKSSTRGSVSVRSRHEPVSLPEGQSASRPERLVSEAQVSPTQPLTCLSFCGVLPPPLLSFFRAGFPGVCLIAGVATSAIRGVSRCGCVTSPYSGKVLPDSRGQWHQEQRAPTQEPRILQVSLYNTLCADGYRCTYLLVGYLWFWVFSSLLNQPKLRQVRS